MKPPPPQLTVAHLLSPDLKNKWLQVEIIQKLLSDRVDTVMLRELELRVGCPGNPLCVGIITVQVELVLTVDTFAQFGRYATSVGHSKQEIHSLAKLRGRREAF